MIKSSFKLFLVLILYSLLVACKSQKEYFEKVVIPRPATASYEMAQVEPSIYINPSNPAEIIAGTVMDDYYYSLDSGKTWVSETIDCEFGVNGDPVMHIDKKGRYYYIHLSRKEDKIMDRIVCQYKDDISGDWETSFTKPDGKIHDKPWITECPKTGNLYMSWTRFDEYKSNDPADSSFIFFSKSTDRGENWSTPIRISKHGGDCLDGNNTVEGAVPAVDNEGNVFVVWTGPHGTRMNFSQDKGNTWWEEEILIDKHHGWSYDVPGLFRCNGLPIVKVDNSKGENHGRVYVNWTDQRNGEDDTDVFLIFSDDKGKTWSQVKKVNQDKEPAHQFFTWFDIDNDGDLYFVYYDRRKLENNETNVVLAHSADGAQSFDEYYLSTTNFIPEKDYFFGDYTNISVHNGMIRPIWPEMNKGKISLFTSLVTKKELEKLKAIGD